MLDINVADFRSADHDIDPIFLNRWSPRAMSGEEMSEEELKPLFEAARWAPSSKNNQPWRFLYARRNTPNWELFHNLVEEYNQRWAHRAAVLIVVVSKSTFDDGEPMRTHIFDTGAAWANLALQGAKNGLVVHGMQGFHYDEARTALNVPDDFTVEAMVAIGRPGNREDLSEYNAGREKPSPRKPIVEIALEGGFR